MKQYCAYLSWKFINLCVCFWISGLDVHVLVLDHCLYFYFMINMCQNLMLFCYEMQQSVINYHIHIFYL